MATGILGLHFFLFFFGILLVFKKADWITLHMQKFGSWYGFVLALGGLIGSLIFSEIFHYPPCQLCWIQRGFQYPQILLFGMALFRNIKVWAYTLGLSLIGFAIGMYHIIIELNPGLSVSALCGIDVAVPCSNVLTQSYGYITIPVMSATLFLVLGIISYINLRKK